MVNSIDYMQIGMLIVAIITVIVSTYCSYQSIKSSTSTNKRTIEEMRVITKQHFQFQFFAEYTKRYQDLMLKMPKDLDTSPIYGKDVDTYMRLYFDLCSEEYYLHSQGVIDDYVWGLWTEGIKTTMNNKKYKTAWKTLGGYYDDKSFISFMDNLNRDEA